jgi:hypothetical protein
MSLIRTAAPLAICTLALAAIAIGAMGKKDQTLDGLVVQENTLYEFYPGAKDCLRQGTPYLLIPNDEFRVEVHTATDLEHFDRLSHGTWRVKLNGDLSRFGRYEYGRTFWRELTVNYVVDSSAISCQDARLH